MNNEVFVNKALEYIGAAWKDKDISLEKVASSAGFSVAYFDRMFAKATGKSVMEYVRTYKLIRSANILRGTDKSIIEIAFELGYENPENYARAFKAMYDTSPSEYRQNHKNISLNWKDNSTGTVIKRFENVFPDLVRADIDEFTDYLLLTDPIKFMFNIYFTTQIDCAVYNLNDENEYIYVEEFIDPSSINLMLFCKEENIGRYIGMVKDFPKGSIGFLCGRDYIVPEDRFGFPKDSERESFDYAYLEESIKIPVLKGYNVRELNENDRSAVEGFSKTVNPVISRVFNQKHNHSNYGKARMFGLFYKENELAGCALPCFERGRGVYCADIGGIFMKQEHENEENITYLWASVIDMQLKMKAVPMNRDVIPGNDCINIAGTEKMGYTLVAKRYSYTFSQ